MAISSEQFIKTLQHYLQVNEPRLLSNQPTPRTNTNGGFLKAITSLWSNNTTNKEPALSDIAYIQTRSTLTLDIHYLYCLLAQFQKLGLEDTKLTISEQEEATTDNVSILSVGSTFTLSVDRSTKAQPHKSTLQEDIAYIYQFFADIHSLKLHQKQTRSIKGYEQLTNTPLPLNCFKSLTSLELCGIDLTTISLPEQQLTNLVIRHTDGTPLFSTHLPRLKYLMLQDTNLTTLDDDMHNVISVTHFNASHNLFIDIPAGLAAMYNLTSLNLSYNMIEHANTVLGNIHELDLRENRLNSLIGLDRLWALEKLDVRDNQITDVAEITRLTGLPNISHLWVEGNPFTKIQPDYKVEIFRAFQQHDLDITLDSAKYKGRRIQVLSDTPTASAKTDEQVTKLARAKPKKRQVRLGQLKQQDIPIYDDDDDSKKYMHRLSAVEEAVQQEQVQLRKATSLKSRRSSKSGCTRSIEEKKDHAFRKKIEAMRREAGTEWLRVLQEMDVVKKKE